MFVQQTTPSPAGDYSLRKLLYKHGTQRMEQHALTVCFSTAKWTACEEFGLFRPKLLLEKSVVVKFKALSCPCHGSGR
jgi:hypothetical protein